MLRLQHSIRKQTLNIEIDSEAPALALQPRLADINRRYFLPVIERIFDEFSVSDRQIKIARLDVDLGDLPLAHFEEVAAERLYQKLRRALQDTLSEPDEGLTANYRSQPEQASQLELLEHYLRTGTLTFWAPRPQTFNFEESLQELAVADPAGLVAMIKRHGTQKRLLKRLVQQLGEVSLQRLLALLETENAPLIVAYMTDLRKVHHVEPVLTLSDQGFSRFLWMLVLSYTLAEPGSQFNRQSFVKRLLQDMARSAGLEYTEIIVIVRLALRETEKNHPLQSSLPAVISELTRELSPDNGTPQSATILISQPGRRPEERSNEASAEFEAEPQPAPGTAGARREEDASLAADHRFQPAQSSRLNLLEHYLRYGILPFGAMRRLAFSFAEMVAELANDDPGGLVAMIGKLSHQQHVLERLVLQLPEAPLQRLLELLEPGQAMLISGYINDLRKIQRVERVRLLGDKAFARLLWILALSYVQQDHGSQFNRRSFLKWLLQHMAQSQGVEYSEIIDTVRLGVQKIEKDHAFQSSLPDVFRELIRELDDAEFSSRTKTKENHQAAARTSASYLAPWEGDTGDPFDDALARLDFYLGAEQWAARKAWLEQPGNRGLLRFLAAHDALRTRQFILDIARSGPGLPWVVNRLLRAFAPGELLAVLASGQQEFITRLIEVLSNTGEGVTRTNRGQPDILEGILWQTALEYLLREPSGRWNRRTMVGQVVAVGAERLGISPALLAGMSARALERVAGTVDASLAQSLETIERTLNDRSLRSRLSFTRYDQIEVLRYYLRYELLPWSTVLRNPQSTAEGAFASLPAFSRSLLSAIFVPGTPDDQLRALRAVRMMPEECLSQLLLRLLPVLGEADSPLRSALSEYAAKAEDKHIFYAQLIAAILNRHHFDLEKFAGPAFVPLEAAAPELPADPTKWEAHVLKSAIANRLRIEDTFSADEPTLVALLHALVETYPEDARHFCRALQVAPLLLATLIKHCTTTLFDRLLELLSPGASQTLNVLIRSLAAIQAAHATRSEESLRQLVFHELLRLEDGRSLDDGVLFARVMRRLFSTPPPDHVRRQLLRKVAALTTSGTLPVGHVAALEAAITEDSQEPATARRPPVSYDEIFAFLEGEKLEPGFRARSRKSVGPRRPELLSDDALRHTLMVTLENYPEEIYPFIIQHVEDLARRERWVETLPESTLARLTYLLEPRMYRTLIDAAEVLASAWLETAPAAHATLTERRLFWTFLLEFLSRTTPAKRSVERLVLAFVEHIAGRCQATLPDARDRLSVGARMLEQADQLASTGGRANLRAVFQRHRTRLISFWEPSTAPVGQGTADLESEKNRQSIEAQGPRPRPNSDRGKTAFSMPVEPDDAEASEALYVDNAGLVLTAPFLPHLFQTLRLLDGDAEGRTRLRDQEAASRAVHLLQYVVDGRTDAPEPALVLNKVLCGLPASVPVAREIEPTDLERDACEQMLKSMLANWKILSNTSIAGLQETFIKRDGRLELSDQRWKLRVQRKTLDVLVDQIPWSISIIYHRWMPQPLHVEW